MFDRYRRTVDEAADLNIIPVMNLFMVLIPFLLLGAAFYHIGVIPTSIPSHDPQEADVPKTPTTVLASLVVDEAELRLSFDSTSLSMEELQDLAVTLPKKKDGSYDTRALQARLVEVKAKYPKSNTITILPHDRLKYQDLVGVLDVTRERQTKEVDDKGDPKFEDLFPVTIFSKFVKPAPEPEEPAQPVEGEGSEEGLDDGEGGEEGADEGGEE